MKKKEMKKIVIIAIVIIAILAPLLLFGLQLRLINLEIHYQKDKKTYSTEKGFRSPINLEDPMLFDNQYSFDFRFDNGEGNISKPSDFGIYVVTKEGELEFEEDEDFDDISGANIIWKKRYVDDIGSSIEIDCDETFIIKNSDVDDLECVLLVSNIGERDVELSITTYMRSYLKLNIFYIIIIPIMAITIITIITIKKIKK